MERKFTTKTKEGSRRLVILTLVLIVVFAFAARLVESDFGRIKIEKITLDVRGGALDGELYYPAGTKDADKIPAVVTTHGAFTTYGVSKLYAEELAKRGFVVFNVSSYKYGLSEYSDFDTTDPEITSKGINDAINFVRTLKFVDKTRLGVVGHSMGSLYSNYATVADCGYFTLNDLKLNILHDTFGIEIAPEEIYNDADAIAAKKLNADKMIAYNLLADEATEKYNTRLKVVVGVGTGATSTMAQKEVTVAGNQVKRSIQCSVISMFGAQDHIMDAWRFRLVATNQAAYYSPGVELVDSAYYVLDDETQTSQIAGKLYETTVLSSSLLAQGAADKCVRLNYTASNMTHSKEFFAPRISEAVTEVFTQLLGYNNGDLGAADAKPIASTKTTWTWRAAFNCLSMFSMLAMLIALAALMLNCGIFRKVRKDIVMPAQVAPVSKKFVLVSTLIIIAVGFASMWVGIYFHSDFLQSNLFMLYYNIGNTYYYLIGMALLNIGLVAYCEAKAKKAGLPSRLSALNIKQSVREVGQTVGFVAVLMAAGYGSLLLIDYLFGEDFRFWMTIFTYMRPEWWIYSIPYAVLMIPLFWLNGLYTNYSMRTDRAEWKDDLDVVCVSSMGVWILAVVNLLIAILGNFEGIFWAGKCSSGFSVAYQFLLIVPLTVYISRKMYKLTGSLTAGAILNTMLIMWTHISETGIYNQNMQQTILSHIFN